VRRGLPRGLITLEHGSIMDLPVYHGVCLGCGECVTVCPGLAINLVVSDYDRTRARALLMLPFELHLDRIRSAGRSTPWTWREPGWQGERGRGAPAAGAGRRHLVLLEVPAEDKLRVAGFTIRGPSTPIASERDARDCEDPIVCRCERVRKSAIVAEIRQGVRDLNQLKALARVSMGGCGGKTLHRARAQDLPRGGRGPEGGDTRHRAAAGGRDAARCLRHASGG